MRFVRLLNFSTSSRLTLASSNGSLSGEYRSGRLSFVATKWLKWASKTDLRPYDLQCLPLLLDLIKVAFIAKTWM
jgi:hypothetical protein